MSLTFELWDMGTGNFLEAFASEADMLRAVREYARIEGDAYLDDLAVRPVRDVEGRREWLPEINGSELRSKAVETSWNGGVTLRASHVEQQQLHDAASQQANTAPQGLNRSGSGESRSA
jgi:hypothetical protein